jgi:hypothetical protein
MQTWRKVANHLPPLVGEEPLEMTAGEEDDDNDGERTESDSEAFSQEAVGHTRGTKRGATSSSQTSREEDIEEEETTCPSEEKAPADSPTEQRPKRLRQTILESSISL